MLVPISVLWKHRPWHGVCFWVQKGSRRVQEITLNVSTQHCSCHRASVLGSSQSSTALCCWSVAWLRGLLSISGSPRAAETLAFRGASLKVAGWTRYSRTASGAPLLGPLPPRSVLEPVDLSHLLVRQKLFCNRHVGLNQRPAGRKQMRRGQMCL